MTTKAGEIFQSLTFDEFFVLVSTLQASEDNFQKKILVLSEYVHPFDESASVQAKIVQAKRSPVHSPSPETPVRVQVRVQEVSKHRYSNPKDKNLALNR